MRTITLAGHAGFCFGVGQAVERACAELDKAQAEHQQLYSLGALIHNKEVTEGFAQRGMITVSGLEEVPAGSVVLVRAHGEPPETFLQAARKNLTLVDATCPFVSKIHQLASEAAAGNRTVVIVGDPAHPEVAGITGWAGAGCITVDSPEDVQAAEALIRDRPVTVVAQTTITGEKFRSCVGQIRAYTDDAVIFDTICQATKQRQDGALELAGRSDLMVVIGDRTSSNSRKIGGNLQKSV